MFQVDVFCCFLVWIARTKKQTIGCFTYRTFCVTELTQPQVPYCQVIPMSLYACYTIFQLIGFMKTSQNFGLSITQRCERSILPLHEIFTTLGRDLLKCLPALHALPGCDITSNILIKLSALNTIHKPDDASLIINFDCPPPITDSTIELAE